MSPKLITRSSILLQLLLLCAIAAHGATFTFNANLSGANEVPPNSSTATGSGSFTFDTTAQNIAFSVTYSGLSSNAAAAHIHFGPPGVSGPIILPFSPNPTGTSGSISGLLTAANLINQATTGIATFTDVYNSAVAGNLYANLHTTNFPGGEIRGQLTPATTVPEPTTTATLVSALVALSVSRFVTARRFKKPGAQG